MTAFVVTGYGLNCEEETAHAYRKAGLDARIVHAADLFSGAVSLAKATIVHLSGGFSFGDDLGSGRVFANRMTMEKRPSGTTLLHELAAFTKDGGYLYGVCNGFQILVKAGLLPNIGGDFAKEVTLTHNDSGRFEDRWVTCGAPDSPSPAFRGRKTPFSFPARHAEGKLVTRDPAIRAALVEKKLVALTYLDGALAPAHDYPHNPNGSELACAGLTDPTGRVLGTMPHPEAFLVPTLHPDFYRRERDGDVGEAGDGLLVFQNLVAAAKANSAATKVPTP